MNKNRKNKYKILEILQETQLESIYLAKSNQNKLYIIQHIKISQLPLPDRDISQNIFTDIAHKLCQLSTEMPKSLKYKEYYIKENDFYLVQEYIKGISIFEIVKTKSPFTQGTLVLTLAKILSVLKPLHDQGLTHGNINPYNIIISSKYQQPILININLWSYLPSSVQINHNFQASYFQTHANDFNSLDLNLNKTVEGDLYSLSLTAIYALTGKLPHQLPKSKDTEELIWHQQARQIDSKIVRILSRAVNPSPEYRFVSAREMLKVLSSHLKLYGYSYKNINKKTKSNQLIQALPSALGIALVTIILVTSVVLGFNNIVTNNYSENNEQKPPIQPQKETEDNSSENSKLQDQPPNSTPSPENDHSDDTEESQSDSTPSPEKTESPQAEERETDTNQNTINLTLNNKETLAAQMPDRSIALTFDDGPSPKHTEEILKILKKYNVHATFFVVGSRVKKHCSIVNRIVREGHELGNHTQNHYFLWNHDRKTQLEEISKTQEAIKECLKEPVTVKWFRAPYGAQNETTLQITRELGLNTALWTIDTNDWKRESTPRSIAQAALKVQGKDVVLMHDGTEPNEKRANDPEVKAIASPNRNSTVQALDEIIKNMQSQDFNLMTLSKAFNTHIHANYTETKKMRI